MIEIIWQEFTNGSFPISNRFKAIVHQTKWLFKYPDVAVKQEVNVKVENDVVPEVEEQTCSAPGTSHQSTPVKRNGTASFPAKSPKKQKIEIDSTDGSKNNNGPENDSTNGEGFRTPVTRSKRTFENLQFLFCLQISINFFSSFSTSLQVSPRKFHRFCSDSHFIVGIVMVNHSNHRTKYMNIGSIRMLATEPILSHFGYRIWPVAIIVGIRVPTVRCVRIIAQNAAPSQWYSLMFAMKLSARCVHLKVITLWPMQWPNMPSWMNWKFTIQLQLTNPVWRSCSTLVYTKRLVLPSTGTSICILMTNCFLS